jgi:hypothetical protein
LSEGLQFGYICALPVIAPLPQAASLEIVHSSPPLTTQEKVRLRQLLRTIERGLSTFLEVAKCLQEVRSSRLYRGTHTDFQSWCRETLGLARSSVDGLIRSGEVAQLLIDNGVELAATTTEATVRPLSTLPTALQPVGWQLIQAVSPKCGPTQPIAAKVVRTIKNAIESPGVNDGHKPRSRSHPSRERPFVQAAQTLSAYKGFDAEIVTSHIEKLPSAWSVYTACGNLIERCQLVQERLAERFPELTHA